MTKYKTKPASPTLRFSPTAWAKLLYLRDLGDTEVGGFGVAAEDDLLYVEDFVLVKQSCTPVSVCFEDESVADYFDLQADLGRPPERCARIWLHTHPGRSPQPSTTDEETFSRVFGECEWAVMFIIAEYGETYARLAFHIGPGGSLKIPVEVAFQPPFPASDEEAWDREYQENVVREEPLRMFPGVPGRSEEPGRLLGTDGREYEQDLAWDSFWDAEDRFWREEVTPYG